MPAWFLSPAYGRLLREQRNLLLLPSEIQAAQITSLDDFLCLIVQSVKLHVFKWEVESIIWVSMKMSAATVMERSKSRTDSRQIIGDKKRSFPPINYGRNSKKVTFK